MSSTDISYTGALVKRIYDAREFNAIVNDPGVFQFVAQFGTEYIDTTPLVNNPFNVLLMADGGGVLFIQCEPGIYEVHTAFLKPDREKLSSNGPHIRNACLAAYRWIFTHTDCMALVTRMPAHNRAVTVLSPLVGWVKEFERKANWPTLTGEMVDVGFAAIRYDDWVRKTTDLRESGRWFHERCEAEFRRLNLKEVNHPDDEWHDQHVGACIEMVFGGQPEKAVILYNRYARLAGYGLVEMKSKSPLLFECDGVLMQATDGDFKVILWREAPQLPPLDHLVPLGSVISAQAMPRPGGVSDAIH